MSHRISSRPSAEVQLPRLRAGSGLAKLSGFHSRRAPSQRSSRSVPFASTGASGSRSSAQTSIRSLPEAATSTAATSVGQSAAGVGAKRTASRA